MIESGTSHLVIDGFLEQSLLDSLLAHALQQEGGTKPSMVFRDGKEIVDAEFRVADNCLGGLDQMQESFLDAIRARSGEICQVLGLRPFEIAWPEVELVAHGDRAKFARHIDSGVEGNRPAGGVDRIVSLVFYLHRLPKAFTGGEIAIYPLGDGTPQLVEPVNNRLVAFPSFTAHEVRTVACPSGAFADSRFAINCWLHRVRGRAAKPADQ